MRKTVCLSLVISLSIVTLTQAEAGKDGDTLKINSSSVVSVKNSSFTVQYRNTQSIAVDLSKFYSKESIILDGREYPRRIIKWGGFSSLWPGEDWSHQVDLKEFLPGAIVERKVYDVLDPGKHILIIKFAGYESSPVTFIWQKKGSLKNFPLRGLLIAQEEGGLASVD